MAFIHGSVAEGRERSESDVDIIIIGDVSSADVAFALHPLQDRLCREVNFTRYAPREFASKIAAGHHFLASVLQKQRIFLIAVNMSWTKLLAEKRVASEPTSKKELDEPRAMISVNLKDPTPA